ncbi:unnamed protein product [Ilex paraguariensis]|uniref:Glycosyltransferase n=1 Tax=Ilex paraguariensis TaxID=185542 RepID=A0ABC8T9P4_9AQUA
MGTPQASLNVLMFPWLAHGHISPFLELAKKLAHKNFHVSLCSTPINLSSIKEKITHKYSLSIQLVELHLPDSPELPPHYHTTNGLPAHLASKLKDAFEMASQNFDNIFKTLKPDLLIYDVNQPWAAAIASSHNVPAVQFLTSGAATASFSLHMLKMGDEKFPFPEIHIRGYESLMTRGAVSTPEDLFKDRYRFLEALERSCNIVLIKTVRELEEKYIDYLSVLAEKKLVPLGPLVQDPVSQDEHKDIMQWLDKKNKYSTVFVSFGSEYFLSKEEMEEVAHGLEISMVNFIWVVRFPKGEKIRVEDALPEGFFERVGERGKVVEGWAPQAKIIGHLSTGGFVSHCGWSSIMESMKFGVPIIAIPMHIDQPLNATVLEEVGVGVEVVRDNNGKLQREEIAHVIRKVVVEENGEGVRRKAREVSETFKMKGEEEIEVVVEELLQLCKKKN